MASVNIASWEEVKALKDNISVLLVDVREPNELKETGAIPGSVNIPLNTIEATFKNLSGEEFQRKYQRQKPENDTPIVFHCRSGNRSAKAEAIALNLGFTNVKNYKGGWLEWEKRLKELE